MKNNSKLTVQDLLRLDAIAQHLKIRSRYGDRTFSSDVTAASLAQVAPLIQSLYPCKGEDIAAGLGENLCLTFEEVHGPHDVDKLENHYLKGKKELGFAQLRDELNPSVDALLFQRVHAQEGDLDRWVAVLNLQESSAKAYWNRFHELSHRIAEPPQKMLPFRRHRFEASNPIESLIDSVASEIAFYEPIFGPLVQGYAKAHRLSFDIIEQIRDDYAPTASLLSTINAIVRYWPRPAACVTAARRGRRNNPEIDIALRVTPQAHNALAEKVGLFVWSNMRAPLGSPIELAFSTSEEQNAVENLGVWKTSAGKALTPIHILTSARRINDIVYAVLST